jgi:hypothetical protein
MRCLTKKKKKIYSFGEEEVRLTAWIQHMALDLILIAKTSLFTRTPSFPGNTHQHKAIQPANEYMMSLMIPSCYYLRLESFMYEARDRSLPNFVMSLFLFPATSTSIL